MRSNITTNTKSENKAGRINRKSNIQMFTMCLPAIIKLLIFQYIPMVGVIMAFQNFLPRKGIFGSPLIGFKNFEFFFKSGTAFNVTFNTIVFNAIFIISGLFFAVAIALILSEITRKSVVKSFQTIVFFPYFISWALVGLIMTSLLNSTGFITSMINSVSGVHIDFYNEPNRWWLILPLINLWKSCGVSAIIYYANILTINREYYEAAYIDGATKMQCARHITLPFIMPMIVTLTLLSLGGIIRSDFGIFYFATRNVQSLYPVTTVIDTYVYRALETIGDFSMGTAIGLYQSVIGFILVIISNSIVRKRDKERALF